jgi:hypothetical protein
MDARNRPLGERLLEQAAAISREEGREAFREWVDGLSVRELDALIRASDAAGGNTSLPRLSAEDQALWDHACGRAH